MPEKAITINGKDYFGDFHNLDRFMGVKDGYEAVWQWPGDFSSGFFYLIKLKPGLILTIIDHHSIQPISVSYHDPGNRLVLSFVLTGMSPLQINNHIPSFSLSPSQSYLTYMPESSGVMQFPRLTKHCCIGILLERRLLAQFLDDSCDRFPDGLKGILNSHSLTHQYHRSLSITPIINLRLHELLGCRYQGSIRRYFFESKVLELLVLSLEQLKCGPTRNREAFPFGDDTCDFIIQTRNILIGNMADPPSLAELARQVGVNKTTLNQCFRKTYGASIFEYLRICRLEKSKDLLRGGGKTVTDVALEVGYSKQSSFTTEFKKYFGENPKNYLY